MCTKKDLQTQGVLGRQPALDGVPAATLRTREGYDHSYFFIASFVDEHITFHAKALRRRPL